MEFIDVSDETPMGRIDKAWDELVEEFQAAQKELHIKQEKCNIIQS
jgi:hypothetical protein